MVTAYIPACCRVESSRSHLAVLPCHQGMILLRGPMSCWSPVPSVEIREHSRSWRVVISAARSPLPCRSRPIDPMRRTSARTRWCRRTSIFASADSPRGLLRGSSRSSATGRGRRATTSTSVARPLSRRWPNFRCTSARTRTPPSARTFARESAARSCA